MNISNTTCITITEKIQRVLNQLNIAGAESLVVQPMHQSPNQTGAMGQYRQEGRLHRIHLSEQNPFIEHTAIHELLHALLRETKYPDVSVDFAHVPKENRDYAGSIEDRFSNCLDHQVIFRRMQNEFQLEMQPYYASKLSEQLSEMDDPNYYGSDSYVLIEILGAIEWMLWGEAGEQLLNHLRGMNADAVRCIEGIHAEIERIGVETPDNVKAVGEMIRDRVVAYGQSKNADPQILKIFERIRVPIPSLEDPQAPQ